MIRVLSIFICGLILVGCGEDEEETPAPLTGAIPGVHSIPLGSMLASSPSLTTSEEDCEVPEGMNGVFGFAIGGACHTAPLASAFLVGNAAVDYTCEDYAAAGDNPDVGFLVHLLCNPAFTDNMQSLAFVNAEANESVAVNFEQFGSETAVGSWSRGGANSFPADMRIWTGTTLEDLRGSIAVHLENFDEGTVYIDGFDETSDYKIKVDFKNPADGSGCAAGPSEDSCFYQHITIYSGEGVITDGPPNGFELYIYGDSKTNPDFIAVEGKYRYSTANAAVAFSDAFLADTRTIYFQSVKNSTQIYGSFDFQNESGTTLSADLGGGFDLFAYLKEGRCSTLGDTDDGFDECTAITASDYTNLWKGDSAMTAITATPVDVTFDNPPTAEGIVTAP